MALRTVRLDGDEILRKRSREVEKIDEKILTLLDDMVDTMYDKDGIGLAAPQIGILKRLVVIQVDDENLYKMINPKITKTSGEDVDTEGCLSVPGRIGLVKRPLNVTVEYTDIEGNLQTLDAEGLLARCVCHELDHLDGILYIDKMIREVEVDD